MLFFYSCTFVRSVKNIKMTYLIKNERNRFDLIRKKSNEQTLNHFHKKQEMRGLRRAEIRGKTCGWLFM